MENELRLAQCEAPSVEDIQNEVRPVGLAEGRRERLASFLILTAPIIISIPMVLAGHYFRTPQLTDWGVKAAMLEIPYAFNLLLFAIYPQE